MVLDSQAAHLLAELAARGGVWQAKEGGHLLLAIVAKEAAQPVLGRRRGVPAHGPGGLGPGGSWRGDEARASCTHGVVR